jgi:dolichyl-phosphate-mannose-protein mannosyltransferase
MLPPFRRQLEIAFILWIAYAIALHALAARTFHGDELGSLSEAFDLGSNRQAISYFILLRLWMLGGDSEFWLRAPSAMTTVIAVAAMFVLARKLSNQSIALAASILLATAPFALVYSQQVRFYSLFLLAATLSLWRFVECLKNPTRQNFVILVSVDLFLLTTHLMASLLVASELLHLFLTSRSFSQRRKLLVLSAAGTGLVLLAFVPITREVAFNALSMYVNDPTRYSIPRGLTATQLAKIPLSAFFFTFGESVYPFELDFVIPGTIIYVLALVVGVWRMRDQKPILAFFALTCALAFGAMYLLLDALIPSGYTGASPRYLIFLLPVFYVIVAASLRGDRNRWLIVPLLLVNLVSMSSFWYGNWAYTDDLINWRAVTQWVEDHSALDSLVLIDGRSEPDAARYFPRSWAIQSTWFYQESHISDFSKFSRIVFLSNDYHQDKREASSTIMQQIERDFDRTAVWSKYPLFAYIYDRKEYPVSGFFVDERTGSMTLPTEVYGLEFQDLTLPLEVNTNSHVIHILGTFGLPGLDKQLKRELPLAMPRAARKLWVLSNVTDAAFINPGSVLGSLIITSTDGSVRVFPLRAGFETSPWNAQCQPLACSIVYRWRKKLALLGEQSYPGSWEEFDAFIFSAGFDLNQTIPIKSIAIERVPSLGVLYIWGIILE